MDIKKSIVTGYFSAFGNIDSDGDIMMPGCFQKSISENGPNASNRIQFLWQHDVTQPLGKPSVLKEDGYGLYFEGKIEPTTWGKNALILYDAGVINEHSIGFVTVKEQNMGDHNEIREVKLYEGSAVTFGANQYTPATGMKGMKITKDQFAEKCDKFMKSIKAGAFSGDNEYLLDIGFAQIKADWNSLMDYPGSNPTPDPSKPLDPLKSDSQTAPAFDPKDEDEMCKAIDDLKKRIS